MNFTSEFNCLCVNDEIRELLSHLRVIVIGVRVRFYLFFYRHVVVADVVHV